MKANKEEKITANDVKMAVLENTITHINNTLIRFEKRFDHLEDRFDKIDDNFCKIDKRFDKNSDKLDDHKKYISNRIWLQFTFTFGVILSLFAIAMKVRGF